MIAVASVAGLVVVMAVVAVLLALALSPWVLLAWPGCGVLFGLFMLVDSRERRDLDRQAAEVSTSVE